MTKDSKIKYRNGLKEIVDKNDWQFFLTLTTSYPLEIHYCSKIMKRYCDVFVKWQPTMFWVAERFTDSERGYHIHAVLKLEKPCKPIDTIGHYYLQKEWQKVADIHRNGKANISLIERFESGRATSNYLTKEIEDSTQWGILPDF